MIIQWSNQTSQVRLYMPHWRSWNQCLNQQPFLVPSKPRAHWCCALKNQEFPKKTQIINLINQSQMPVWISGFRRIFLPLSGVKRHIFVNGFIGEGYSFEDSLPAQHGKSLGVWLLLRSLRSGGVLGGAAGQLFEVDFPNNRGSSDQPPNDTCGSPVEFAGDRFQGLWRLWTFVPYWRPMITPANLCSDTPPRASSRLITASPLSKWILWRFVGVEASVWWCIINVTVSSYFYVVEI